MGNRINRYLDTCDCVISFECEGDEHINPVTINRCPIHAHLTDPTEHRDVLYAADMHRALVQLKILELIPEELKITNGDEAYFTSTPLMRYDNEGDLIIKIDGLSQEQAAPIEEAVNEDESLNSQVPYQVFLE